MIFLFLFSFISTQVVKSINSFFLKSILVPTILPSTSRPKARDGHRYPCPALVHSFFLSTPFFLPSLDVLIFSVFLG